MRDAERTYERDRENEEIMKNKEYHAEQKRVRDEMVGRLRKIPS